MPVIGYVLMGALLYWHFDICYSVGETRAPRNIRPFATYIAPYLFLFMPMGISFFDDRITYQRVQRVLVALVLAINISWTFDVAWYWTHARPNRGPYLTEMIVIAPILFPVIWLFTHCLDSICMAGWDRLRQFTVRDPAVCPNCHYDLRGTVGVGTTCPECGESCPVLLDE